MLMVAFVPFTDCVEKKIIDEAIVLLVTLSAPAKGVGSLTMKILRYLMLSIVLLSTTAAVFTAELARIST